jgi:WD40 repeat protein
MEARGGTRFLLTCAMTRYEHCAEWDREELREDVARIKALFCGDFLPEAGQYRHTDVLGESPTSVELKDRLRDFFLSTDRHPDDFVVVYLVGHGEILDDGDFVVLTHDTHPSDLLNRTVAAGEIVKMVLANTRIRRLLLLLDTCYSGQGGADITREALRRINDRSKRSDDQDETSEGHGVVVVAATRPYERALPGAFTSCLDRAARSLAAAGNAPQTLRVGALIGAVNSDQERPKSQTSVWHQVGMTGDEPSFILNPRYRPGLVGVDLLEQERARHAEQRESQTCDHFLPASRWFTGRRAALMDLNGWLDDPAGRPAAVITGDPGSGKTAVLGLLARLSDPDQAPGVPRGGLPEELVIQEGVFADAIYASTMTTAEIRDRIAATVGMRAETTQDLLDGLQHGDGTAVVLVDAVDEADDPGGLVRALLNPLMRAGKNRIRLMLGTRRHLLTAQLLGNPGSCDLLDLDSPRYSDPGSIRAHIRHILLSDDSMDSAYRPSGFYRTAPSELVEAVVEAIADTAGSSFLVAQITAATEATATRLPDLKDPAWRQTLPRHAGEAMRRDLRLRLGTDAEKAIRLLLPLAYARGSGLPWENIWPSLVEALSPGHGYGHADLTWLRKAAGSYSVEGLTRGGSVYRLYHQALTECLLDGRDQRADQQAITHALVRVVPPREGGIKDWPEANFYIRTHLATHAAQAGRIDDLLTDPGYLLAADRPQLLAALGTARSAPARAAADTYRRAAKHLRTKPVREHASYLQLAARCGRAPVLANALESCRTPGTWSSRWASWRLEASHHTFSGRTHEVSSVALGELNGRPVVVSASEDATVRVWDLTSGDPRGDPFTGHHGPVNAVAVAELDGRPVVVSGGDDGTVRVWDLASGAPLGDPFTGHHGPVNAVAIGELDGRPVVVSGGDDGTVRVWDLASGAPTADPFTGHTGRVNAVAVGELDGRPVVVCGSGHFGHSVGTVRVWDLASGAPLGDPFTGHHGPVNAVAIGDLDERPVAISGGEDGTVRVWHLASGAPTADPFTGHTGRVTAVAVGELDGRPVVISGGGEDGTVRVWDLAAGALLGDPFTGHGIGNPLIGQTDVVSSVALGKLDGLPVVVSGGGDDDTVRVWELVSGAPVSDPFTGHRVGNPLTDLTDVVPSLALGELDGRPVVISASKDATVRVRDPASGAPLGDPFTGHTGRVNAVATAVLDGRPVVVSGGDATVRVWDLASGAPVGDPFTGHTGQVNAVATAVLDGRPVVVSGGVAGTVLVWDPASGAPVGVPILSHQTVYEVATAVLDGRPLVVVYGQEFDKKLMFFYETVQVWDLAHREPLDGPRFWEFLGMSSVAVGQMGGMPVVAIAGGWCHSRVRIWNVAKRRFVRLRLRRVHLRHKTDVRTVLVVCRQQRVMIITGCRDNVAYVWDLATRQLVSSTVIRGGSGVNATAFLAPDRVVYANGGTLSVYAAANDACPTLTIELDSKISALATQGTSMVIAATELGLVAIEIP